MKLFTICLLSCCLLSCSLVPTPVVDASGKPKVALLFGGKGHLEYGPGGAMSYTYSNERSFQHFTQAVTAGVIGYANAGVSKAREITTQVANSNAAKVQSDQIAAAAAAAASAAKLEATKTAISARATVTPITVTAP